MWPYPFSVCHITQSFSASVILMEVLTQLKGSINSDASAAMTTTLCTSQTIYSTSSYTIEESANYVDTSKPRKVTFMLPIAEPRCNLYRPNGKAYQKSPLRKYHSIAGEPVKNTSKDPNHSCHSLFHRYRKDGCPIRSIDGVGFRYLNHPLQVEYSSHLQRWMFSVELQERTVIAGVCTEVQSNKKTHTPCKNDKIQQQFTCLDDGYTWILTGDVDKNGRVKQTKNVTRDSSPLYTHISRERLRILDNDEAAKKRSELEICEGKFLRWRAEPEEYVMAIKYVPRQKMGWLIRY